MRKIAAYIIKLRYVILIIALISTIFCALMIGSARINYDFTEYLSDETMTKRSLMLMQDEFSGSAALRVMLQNPAQGGAEETAALLNGMDGVLAAAADAENGVKTVDGRTYALIELTLDCEDTEAFTEKLEETLDGLGGRLFESAVVSGDAAQMLEIQKNIAVEMPVAMGIAVLVVIGMLFLTSHAYIEPLIFSIVLLVSIVINMGTNWIFDSISFVTFAVAAILQLALAMDYSIIRLHNFNELRDEGLSDRDALIEGLARSFLPVFSSALTTVAGLAALMFMSFTIGFDIGIVLAKGILFSMLTVFLLMPALIYAMRRPLQRTSHKPVPLGGEKIGRLSMRIRRAAPIVLAALIVSSAYLQSTNTYTFTDSGENETSRGVKEIFGERNQLIILFPKCETDEEYARQREMLDQMAQIQTDTGDNAVADITAMTTTGAMALEYYTAEQVSEQFGVGRIAVDLFFAAQGFGKSVRADQLITAAATLMPDNETVKTLSEKLTSAMSAFNGENHSRAILTLRTAYGGSETHRVLEEITEILSETYGDTIGVVGTAMSGYDIESAFSTDIKRVSLITIAAIVLIIFLSFKSAAVPVILVCVIQGAIWITMAVSKVLGQPIFFMCYLICTAIQMGATIDYGILMTSNYRLARQTLAPEDAAVRAMKLSLPTIFTSGVILVLAGFIIGKVCSVYYISAIGLLIARGALISILLTLFALPGLNVILDKAVMKHIKGLGRMYDPKRAKNKERHP